MNKRKYIKEKEYVYEIGVWGKNKKRAHLVKMGKFLIVLQKIARISKD